MKKFRVVMRGPNNSVTIRALCHKNVFIDGQSLFVDFLGPEQSIVARFNISQLVGFWEESHGDV